MNGNSEKNDTDEKSVSVLLITKNNDSEKNKSVRNEESEEYKKCEEWRDVSDISTEERHNKAKMYVVIYNIGKKKNVGCIIRSCVAFNVHKVFIIGNKKKKAISFFGNIGTYKYIDIEYFPTIQKLKEYLKSQNILLYGCEITDYSISVATKPFIKDTAFLFGNEGTGIDDEVLKFCDKVIYIPQYGNGTSSLNVSVSCSIILHHFAEWATYKETEIKGKKFSIKECPNKLDRYLNPSDTLSKEISEKRLNRMNKKQKNEFVSLENIFST